MCHCWLVHFVYNASYMSLFATKLRACLHGGVGPQVGEVTRLGGVTHLSIYFLIFKR